MWRDLGEKLNVGPEMLRKWLRQARVGAGAMPEQTSAQLVEIRRLKKRGACFFARELDPRRLGWVPSSTR